MLGRLRVWWRCRKLEKGYQKIAEAELDKTVGFTPIMRKWELMEQDGYIELEDGEKRWLWP